MVIELPVTSPLPPEAEIASPPLLVNVFELITPEELTEDMPPPGFELIALKVILFSTIGVAPITFIPYPELPKTALFVTVLFDDVMLIPVPFELKELF